MNATERHPHGTPARYARGPNGDGANPCRRDCCREAHKAAQRRNTKLRAYGRSNRIDAEPARRHAQHMRGLGLSVIRIAALAGVSNSAVRGLLGVEPGREPSRSIRRDIAERILTVHATSADQPDGAMVPVHGTRRRIQALVAAGRSLSVIARELDSPFSQIHAIAHGQRRYVRAGTARNVTALLDRLWDVPPPDDTDEDRRLITRARTMAARHHWAPIAAWDDDEIDDPHALPRGVGVTRDTDLENDVARLAADGMRTADIARTLGRHQRVVAKVRARVARDQAGAA